MVGRKKGQAEPELLHLGGAFDPLGAGLRTGKCREQQRSQDGNDGDDDEQFNEGECAGARRQG